MRKGIILVLSLLAIVSIISALERVKVRPGTISKEGSEIPIPVLDKEVRENKSNKYEQAKEITTPDGFINTSLTSDGRNASISVEEFIGNKVILIDFWTYSCINCQRTTPFLNAWYEKYKDKGLVILGVHTPEFEFEKEYGNVLSAVERFDIKYPVVLDNDYSTWYAYKNRYWPRKYLIDIDGYIVYDHIGEGAYDETERVIQDLLEERMIRLALNDNIDRDITTIDGAKIPESRSPEVYFGASRNQLLANGPVGTEGVYIFEQPLTLQKNLLYLSGAWDIKSEFSSNKDKNAAIIFSFEAKNVNIVASAPTSVDVEVTVNGMPLPDSMRGKHVEVKNGKTIVTVRDDQLYELIQNDAGVEEGTLELRILSPDVRVYTFTFG